MRIVGIFSALVAVLGSLCGTTLQQLSLDDMTRKSSEIVRGRVHCTGVAFRGSVLYTNYRVQVSEQWKGTPSTQLDFAVPGGLGNGIRQSYSGAPSMVDGQEVVLFLWTSRSGLRQVIGLSQGLFTLSQVSNSQPLVTRGAPIDRIVDTNGQELRATDFSMPLSDFRAHVATTLNGRPQ